MDYNNMSVRAFRKMLRRDQLTTTDLLSLARSSKSNLIIDDIIDYRNAQVNHELLLELLAGTSSLGEILKLRSYRLLPSIKTAEEAERFLPYTSEYADEELYEELLEKFPTVVNAILQLIDVEGDSYPHKELRTAEMVLSTKGFSDEAYETVYPIYLRLAKRVHGNYTQHIKTFAPFEFRHTPASVLYLICVANPQTFREEKNLDKLIHHPNLTLEIVNLLPKDKQEYASLLISKNGTFNEINKNLSKPAANVSMKERLETEAFKTSVNYEAYKARQNDFELFETSLKASQDLAEILIEGLNSPLPVNLKIGLDEVNSKTSKLYDFYQKLLSSPFNPQGERALNYAKKSAEESLIDYEGIIDTLMDITESENNAKPRRDNFDKLKADAETCLTLDQYVV